MLAGAKKLEDLSRDLPFTFDGLVGIGVGTHRDRVADVTRRRQFLLEQRRRIGLGKQLGFEIQTRRKVEVSVRGTGIAIDATMLAALVGIDRLSERYVGRIVARDDRARRLDRHNGFKWWRIAFWCVLLLRSPPVVDRFAYIASV